MRGMGTWGRAWTSGLGLAAGLLLGAGCAHGPATSATARPERLDLLLTSVAVDLDGKPGADGFGARIYASSRRSAQLFVSVRGSWKRFR